MEKKKRKRKAKFRRQTLNHKYCITSRANLDMHSHVNTTLRFVAGSRPGQREHAQWGPGCKAMCMSEDWKKCLAPTSKHLTDVCLRRTSTCAFVYASGVVTTADSTQLLQHDARSSLRWNRLRVLTENDKEGIFRNDPSDGGGKQTYLRQNTGAFSDLGSPLVHSFIYCAFVFAPQQLWVASCIIKHPWQFLLRLSSYS